MRIRALIIRIIRQFLHDKRTLALMFAAPLLILTLISFVFNGDTYRPKIGAVDVPPPLIQLLEKQDAQVTGYTFEDANHALDHADIDAVLTLTGPELRIKLEGSDPTKNKAVLLLLQKTAREMTPAGETPTLRVDYLHGSEEMTPFDNFGPVLVGFFAFFFVFLIAGIAFLRERTGGTLERLLASPLRRWEIVLGYVIGFGIFTILQAALITWFAVDVLGLMMTGSYVCLMLIVLLLSMTALTLGTLLSSFAANEFQMVQFIPIAIVPQIFFSGLFSLDSMAPWLRGVAYIMPLTYGAEALREIMIRGKGWNSIAMDVFALLLFSLVFMLLNILTLKKHRRL